MIPQGTRILVVGAGHHQGLAVVRGLAGAGARVVAGSARDDCPAFRSRFAAGRLCYRSASNDPSGFIDDVMHAVHENRAELVLPASQSTVVALASARPFVEATVRVGVAPAGALTWAHDTHSVLTLARKLAIRAPAFAVGTTAGELLERAHALRAPFVVTLRGTGRAPARRSVVGMDVCHVPDIDSLRTLIIKVAVHADKLLVRECLPGITRCISGVWQRGAPIALFAYERERELPGADGISVMRRSIPLEDAPAAAATRLLEAAGWHGVGVVEFRYDRRTKEYALAGVRTRFQTSTALAIASGVNLPALAATVHLGGAVPARSAYRTRVVSRWLAGDVQAAWTALTHRAEPGAAPGGAKKVIWPFVRDFTRASRYDELCSDDWLPALASARNGVRRAGRRALAWARGLVRRPASGEQPAARGRTTPPSVPSIEQLRYW